MKLLLLLEGAPHVPMGLSVGSPYKPQNNAVYVIIIPYGHFHSIYSYRQLLQYLPRTASLPLECF